MRLSTSHVGIANQGTKNDRRYGLRPDSPDYCVSHAFRKITDGTGPISQQVLRSERAQADPVLLNRTVTEAVFALLGQIGECIGKVARAAEALDMRDCSSVLGCKPLGTLIAGCRGTARIERRGSLRGSWRNWEPTPHRPSSHGLVSNAKSCPQRAPLPPVCTAFRDQRGVSLGRVASESVALHDYGGRRRRVLSSSIKRSVRLVIVAGRTAQQIPRTTSAELSQHLDATETSCETRVANSQQLRGRFRIAIQ